MAHRIKQRLPTAMSLASCKTSHLACHPPLFFPEHIDPSPFIPAFHLSLFSSYTLVDGDALCRWILWFSILFSFVTRTVVIIRSSNLLSRTQVIVGRFWIALARGSKPLDQCTVHIGCHVNCISMHNVLIQFQRWVKPAVDDYPRDLQSSRMDKSCIVCNWKLNWV